MKRKPKAVQPPPVAPVVAVVAAPQGEPWWRSIFTDRNREFDTGRVLVAVVILAMCYFQWYDTSVNGQAFNPQNFGIGIAGVLGGFAAYLYGDAQRPTQPAPSTVTEVKQTQVTTP